jgi:V8-like Glu-specific endopeptidase
MRLFVIGALLSLPSFAGLDAIYGKDNRQDYYAVTNPLFRTLAKSTAAMIDKTNIKSFEEESLISAIPLGQMYHLCPEERFRQQPTAANCSGTLVASDIIMTAGHCYDLIKKTCKDYVWVFDYQAEKESQSSVRVRNQNIYECEDVILKEMDLERGIDHTLVKLKRPVTDRNAAKFRQNEDLKIGMPLVLIGYPSGLPVKIADDAQVLKLMGTSFITNVDAFSVNSGSGVFNAITGEIEGILSSGRADYDGKGNCSGVKVYAMNEGNETVVIPQKVKDFLKSRP